MSLNAFQPTANGLSKLIAASSSTGLAATQICTGFEQGVMLSNPSTMAIYIALGSSSVAAAMPTTAVPAPGMCFPPGQTRPLRVPGGSRGWLSAVTSGGTAVPGMLVTPGLG